MMHQLFSGNLVPVGSDALSIEDTRRLIEARRLIATDFSKKLTLGSIAKACGLNRTNLARGFRALFDCSIAEALAEKVDVLPEPLPLLGPQLHHTQIDIAEGALRKNDSAGGVYGEGAIGQGHITDLPAGLMPREEPDG